MSFLRRLTFCTLGLLIVSVAAVSAANCPAVVKSALDATSQACASTGRNQACYGNVNLTAEPMDASANFAFTKPGDIVDVGGVKKFVLSPLDATTDTWGVALLKIQANVPDTLPGQNVSFILFGDVEIDNAVSASGAKLSVSAKQAVNVREQPSKTGKVIGSLQKGAELVADAVTEDGAWVRVHAADGSMQGWVSASIVTLSGDVKTLTSVKADAPRYNPMQAFYFKSGLNDTPCAEAPDSGILIQTPQGKVKIALNIDGADITLGSTAYLQAQAGGEMIMNVVEGQGTITAGGKTVIVPAGTRARVPLDANLTASGEPVGPEPYDPTTLTALPLGLMPQVVAVTPALDATAIAQLTSGPLPGSWRYGVTSVSAGSGCPPGTEGVITAALLPQTAVNVPPGEFNPRTLFGDDGSKFPASAAFGHPKPDQYTISYSDSGAQVSYTMNIQSPTLITGVSTLSGDGCVLSMNFTINHVG